MPQLPQKENPKRKVKDTQRNCYGFFDKMAESGLALGYNDVRLKTNYSSILPKDADLAAQFSRNVSLNMPIISAPMDTVTEAEMAIAMAQLGGLGIIHKNLSPENQASAVRKVKHKLNAFIPDPICIHASQTVKEVLEFVKMKKYTFLSFPVLDNSDNVVGIVSSSDFKFCMDGTKKISDIMAKKMISAPIGTDISAAYKTMMTNRIKILPVFNRQKKLTGIFTLADVKRIVAGLSPDYNLAPDGTLRVGAAIGVGEQAKQRMELLANAKTDVVVIDTAHGDSAGVIDMVKHCKRHHPNIDVVAGNISEPESAKRLTEAGADGIKVGQGPGSICTTRIIAGVGCPQVTAVYNCSKALRGSGVPVCADGGIEYSGDITIALAAGANTVMLGKLLAGTTESPGEVIFRQDKKQVKVYRGMGSLGAMRDNKASRERYGQASSPEDKLIPEGIESEIDFKGDVSNIVHQLLGGLRSGMGYCGAKNITELQKTADFHRITIAGLKESHPHGLDQVKKAPNY